MSETTMRVNVKFKLKGDITIEKAESLFGKYINDNDFLDFLLTDKKPYSLPYGSNGTLKYSISNYQFNAVLGTTIWKSTVDVYGYLDNYYEDSELEDWFKRSCMIECVESAVMEYKLAERGPVVCTYNDSDSSHIEKFYLYNF